MSGADSACRAGRGAAGVTPHVPPPHCAVHVRATAAEAAPPSLLDVSHYAAAWGSVIAGRRRPLSASGEAAPVTDGGACVLETGRTGRRSHVEWRRGPSGGSRRRVTSSLSPHSLLAYIIVRLAADPRTYPGPRRDGVLSSSLRARGQNRDGRELLTPVVLTEPEPSGNS